MEQLQELTNRELSELIPLSKIWTGRRSPPGSPSRVGLSSFIVLLLSLILAPHAGEHPHRCGLPVHGGRGEQEVVVVRQREHFTISQQIDGDFAQHQKIESLSSVQIPCRCLEYVPSQVTEFK
jgi:hypothetical protein